MIFVSFLWDQSHWPSWTCLGSVTAQGKSQSPQPDHDTAVLLILKVVSSVESAHPQEKICISKYWHILIGKNHFWINRSIDEQIKPGSLQALMRTSSPACGSWILNLSASYTNCSPTVSFWSTSPEAHVLHRLPLPWHHTLHFERWRLKTGNGMMFYF